MEWKTVKLGDCLSKIIDNRGKTPKDLTASGHPLLEINAVSKDNKYPLYGEAKKYVDDVVYSTWFRSGHPQYGDILVPTVGTLGTVAYVDRNDCCIAQNLIALRANADICDSAYIYYLLCNPQIVKRLLNLDIGAVQASIKVPHLLALEIPLPPIETQRRIAAILSSLDDKIENNNRINRNLEAQAQALFKSWFVDFEPFGGTMPEDWEKGNLLDVADLFDHKRIPLSGMQRDRMEKIYPYYGATSVMDYVDNYLYDGIYLLMGEDGSVMTDEGFPFLQYVEGKFWCNNHAHIMQGKNGYTTEMLYCLLNRTNVSGIVTGAVQGKISQASMKKIPVVLPPAKVCADMSGKLAPYFDEIRSLRQESQGLATLRDTLLPKLMKGEIEV